MVKDLIAEAEMHIGEIFFCVSDEILVCRLCLLCIVSVEAEVKMRCDTHASHSVAVCKLKHTEHIVWGFWSVICAVQYMRMNICVHIYTPSKESVQPYGHTFSLYSITDIYNNVNKF